MSSCKITLNLFTIPVKVVIRYGPVTNSIYGSVIEKNVLTGPAPSTVAASYKSAGIF